MLNWVTLCFIFVFAVIFNKLIDKYLLTQKEHKINQRLDSLRTVIHKSVDNQKEYLKLRREQTAYKPSKLFSVIIFLGTILIYNSLISQIPDFYLSGILLIIFSFCIACFIALVFAKEEYVLHNANSTAMQLFFINSYLLIDKMQPLYLFGVKMRLLYLLPMFFIIKKLMEVIEKKIVVTKQQCGDT